MSKPKKFGAFAGVFTPSVLTILGVIMYLRLGWVVGNAGLITALAIIVISHIVSVTTGLSISSVATDKKIKTGGIYYILSRSLGFPMGGAIGIALFIGTALGISLYLVGFAESLLAVDKFREFTGLAQNDLNSFRIVATVALLILVTLAFISTSLAIKSQYFIMGAIVLSLISIIAGVTGASDFSSSTIAISPIKGGVSMQEIFGVFFPAVTGFTAGVAMSGDLKNPEKDIPRGTLASITVGFIVYVVLAILFAFFVDRNLLVNDYNFLLKVSLYAPLVLAGIWGATLSSALGGILGGPRILQAIAKDKIVPELFAKGYGASQEPRNALIFIFLIAEGGILIGNLNAIAGIVSMFYLASYGFINLAFFLENWASTDFRPTFKVKGIIGLVGFVTSFLVMAQLGVLSMIASLVIMFGIFAWLNRKQLKSESGDVWQSVWLSVVRKALYSLNKKNLEERNWQPNIILFSGGENKRPHLLEFGKDLVGRYGLLSNFDLHESSDKKYLFPKHLQAEPNSSETYKGVFTRRQTCSDIYSGIETIISTYGFSGIEPNTVIMGWMRQSKNPMRFSQMIQRIYELDVNILLIDWDKRYGFGNYKTVDIWWRGSGNNGNLALHLMRFLWSSENWKDAKLRLLIGNPENEEADKIRKHAEQILDSMRIEAEIKVINNQIEQKSFYELIRTESLKTDLIILGLPDIREGEEADFVKQTSKLMQDIGTVVLIKASSQFKNLSISKAIITSSEKNNKIISAVRAAEYEKEIKFPDNPVSAENIHLLLNKFNEFDEVYKNLLSKAFIPSFDFIDKIINETENILNERILNDDKVVNINDGKKLSFTSDKLLKTVYSLIRDYKNNIIPKQSDLLKNTYNVISEILLKITEDLTENIIVNYQDKDLVIEKSDTRSLRTFKNKSLLKVKLNKSVSYKIKYKELVKQFIPYENIKIFRETGKRTGMIHIQFIIKLQKLIKDIRIYIFQLQKLYENSEKNYHQINEVRDKIRQEIFVLKELKDDAVKSVYLFAHIRNVSLINKISKLIDEVHPNRYIKKQVSEKQISAEINELQKIPVFWKRNEMLLLNSWKIDILFAELENKMYRILNKSVDETEKLINEKISVKTELLKNTLNNYKAELRKKQTVKFQKADFKELSNKKEIHYLLEKLLISGFEKFKYLTDRFPEKIKLFTDESLNNLTEHQFEDIETVEVSVSSLLDYLIQTELNKPLTEMTDKLPDIILQIEQNIHNIQSVLLFTLFDSDGNLLPEQKENIDGVFEILNKYLHNIEEEEKKAKNEIINIRRKVDERLSEVSNHLNIYSLLKNNEESKRFAGKINHEQKKKAVKAKIKESTKKVNGRRERNLTFVKNIFTKKEDIYPKTISKVKRTLDVVLSVTPDAEVSKSLPFYYKQLFLRENNFNNDFFENRREEINQLKETVKRYQSGYKGGILITGEPMSGKSFLSYYFIEKYLSGRQLYVVKPSFEGSSSLKDFNAAIDNVFEGRNVLSKGFSKIDDESIILFDSVELWFENSDNKFEIIETLKNIIQTYSKRFLIFVNINSFALQKLNKNTDFENYFLNIIDCMPFNKEQILNSLLKRHKAGGLNIMFGEKHESRLKHTEFEKIAEEFYKYSGGNIGSAVIAWIAYLSKYDEETYKLSLPKIPDLSVLNYFSEETNKILKLLLIHKRLNIKQSCQILKSEEQIIKDNFAFLIRSGVIKEPVNDVFELNPFMYVLIKKYLSGKGYL